MSEYIFAPPRIAEEGRDLFEERYVNGDVVATSQIRVDTTLSRLRKNIEKDGPKIDLHQLSDAAESYLAATIDAVPFHQAPSLTEYFHLKIKHALIRQIVFADSVFVSKGDYEQRRELVNGLYGLVAGVLEDAIELFDSSAPKSHHEQRELTGVINELTALALLNRRQTPENLAIPSDVTSDLYHATDLEYYRFPKGSQTSRHYHVQVKSRLGSGSKVRTPLGGLVVASHHMKNKPKTRVSFPTSRAIVAEINGTIDASAEAHLMGAINQFESHMTTEIEKSNAIHDLYMSLPHKMRADIENVYSRVIVRAINENPVATSIIFEIEEEEEE